MYRVAQKRERNDKILYIYSSFVFSNKNQWEKRSKTENRKKYQNFEISEFEENPQKLKN